MSNNAAVCPDGGEIGRAQALQAAAARIEPSVQMNPVLIKPEADARSQVVVMGRVWRTLAAGDYYQNKDFLWGQVTAALDALRAEYELVIIEGAGSAAELNLRQGDIVNMAIARYAHAPVLLIGDIDRGGIFAQLLGTLWLLEPEERALVRGLVVNKFRGDLALFADGVRIIEEKGDVPVLGIIPYLKDLYLPDEDAVSIEKTANPGVLPPAGLALSVGEVVDIAVVRFPRIANFDDFDPLHAEPGVRLRYVASAQELGHPQAIILPGTKSTLADLDWLRANGLAQAVYEFAGRGGSVVGICGGFQMLGEGLHDPQRVESDAEHADGLGLLPVSTRFLAQKTTTRTRAVIRDGVGWLVPLKGWELNGYEIHIGETLGGQPWLDIHTRNPDGAVSPDGKIWGCYLHGLFANDAFRRAWLQSLGWRDTGVTTSADLLNRSLDALADAVETALDMDLLEKIVWES
jgi:adenosylcobyric acid synthase